MTSLMPNAPATATGYRFRHPSAPAQNGGEAMPSTIEFEDGILPSVEYESAFFESETGLLSTKMAKEQLAAEDSSGHVKANIRDLIRLNKMTVAPRRFRMTQHFEGVVTSRETSSFWADIADLTDGSRVNESVEIPFEEISLEDRDILVQGAVFYWSMGYETSNDGQIRRVSEIRVRRHPRWSAKTIAELNAASQKLLDLLSTNA